MERETRSPYVTTKRLVTPEYVFALLPPVRSIFGFTRAEQRPGFEDDFREIRAIRGYHTRKQISPGSGGYRRHVGASQIL